MKELKLYAVRSDYVKTLQNEEDKGDRRVYNVRCLNFPDLEKICKKYEKEHHDLHPPKKGK